MIDPSRSQEDKIDAMAERCLSQKWATSSLAPFALGTGRIFDSTSLGARSTRHVRFRHLWGVPFAHGMDDFIRTRKGPCKHNVNFKSPSALNWPDSCLNTVEDPELRPQLHLREEKALVPDQANILNPALVRLMSPKLI